VLQAALDIYTQEVDTIKNVSGIVPAMVVQPITTETIQAFSNNGGNSLDIDPSDGPLQLVNLSAMVCLSGIDSPFDVAGF
jgi:hypothetical protein